MLTITRGFEQAEYELIRDSLIVHGDGRSGVQHPESYRLAEQFCRHAEIGVNRMLVTLPSESWEAIEETLWPVLISPNRE